MISGRFAASLEKKTGVVEWRLLAFLVLFMDVKLIVKVIAIVLVYVLQPDFKFGFKLKDSRLPIFYLAAIAIALLNYFIGRDFSANYTAIAFTGILFWIVSVLAIHQIKLFTEKTDVQVLHNTLALFLLINAAFSFFDLLPIFAEIGIRNPFHYQGEYQKYFINTGDRIKGILFDISTTNALINCFGIIYFLYLRKYFSVVICMGALILTASNASNIIVFIIFTGLFLYKSTKAQKSIMAICTMMLIIFLGRLSPQNNNYLIANINKFIFNKTDKTNPAAKIIPIRFRPDSLLTPETRKEKIAVLFLDSLEKEKMKKSTTAEKAEGRPEIPKDSIHTPTFQWRKDTTAMQRQLLAYTSQQHIDDGIRYNNGYPGKLLALKQSLSFLSDHPRYLLFGTGAGNFSSKLAFRATGLNITGGWPQRFSYCNKAFLNDHLSLYAWFFLQQASEHSVIHSPASVYDQLLTEYGIAGLATFFICYIGFFARKRKQLSFGVPLLIALVVAFTMDYWFEQLSVVILFELMLFIDLKTNSILSHE